MITRSRYVTRPCQPPMFILLSSSFLQLTQYNVFFVDFFNSQTFTICIWAMVNGGVFDSLGENRGCDTDDQPLPAGPPPRYSLSHARLPTFDYSPAFNQPLMPPPHPYPPLHPTPQPSKDMDAAYGLRTYVILNPAGTLDNGLILVRQSPHIY